MSNLTSGVVKYFSKNKVNDEALNLLDKNVGTITNLITHVTFISDTIDDLIKIIEGMGEDDKDYKQKMLEKAQSVNTEFSKLKNALYTASDSADTKAEAETAKYKETGTSKSQGYARKGKKPEQEKEDAKTKEMTDFATQLENKKKVQDQLLAKVARKNGGNPYKTAKKQLTNLMSYIPSMSTKTQKKRHNRKH